MASGLVRNFGQVADDRRERSFDLWLEVDRVIESLTGMFDRDQDKVPNDDKSEIDGFAQAAFAPGAGPAIDTMQRPFAVPAERQVFPRRELAVEVADAAQGSSAQTIPLVADVVEDNDGYEVTVEVPGVRPGDIDLEFSDGALVITAKRSAPEKKRDGVRNHTVERAFGTLQRRFKLPFQANPDTIEAWFEDGLMRVAVPYPPEIKPRVKKIEIKRRAD